MKRGVFHEGAALAVYRQNDSAGFWEDFVTTLAPNLAPFGMKLCANSANQSATERFHKFMHQAQGANQPRQSDEKWMKKMNVKSTYLIDRKLQDANYEVPMIESIGKEIAQKKAERSEAARARG